MLHLVNKYMDAYQADENNLVAKAKAEQYAKIISKTIINAGDENFSQIQYFKMQSRDSLLRFFIEPSWGSQ